MSNKGAGIMTIIGSGSGGLHTSINCSDGVYKGGHGDLGVDAHTQGNNSPLDPS